MLYLCSMEKELKDFLLDEISFNVGEKYSLIHVNSEIDRLYDETKDIDENITIISSIITKQYEADFKKAYEKCEKEVKKLKSFLKDEVENVYLTNLYTNRIKEEEQEYNKAKEMYEKIKGMDC